MNNDDHYEHDIQPSETIKNVLILSELSDETKISPSLDFEGEKSTIREIKEIESNNIEQMESSGRYHETISPTLTYNINNADNNKNSDESNFLLKGGRRARSSRPQIQEMNSVMPVKDVNSNEFVVPRQNNADIQGIISGIVKLLNGNVNVHTNNQGTRRPPSNRINNRGPPRIAEAQIPENDIQEPTNNIAKPQQTSFQETPLLRPFLTGVPIPEKIVPSMQQNYRPGFVSQNRPPWRRPKPPINRRPVPQYTHHHIPTHLVSEEKPSDNNNSPSNNNTINNKEKPLIEKNADENNYDEDLGTVYEEDTQPPSTLDDQNLKEISSTIANENIPSTVITIIQSTSEVNTVDQSDDIFSTLGNSDINKTNSNIAVELEPSVIDIVSHLSISHSPTPTEPTLIQFSPKPTITSSSNPINTIKSSSQSTSNQQNSYQTQYVPRPGVVLDDPEFNSAHKPHHIPPQRQRPAGYGEIFDVTLSAVQFGKLFYFFLFF